MLVDANILIYAVNSDAPLHSRARSWLEKTLSGPDTLGLAWTVILAFLRLTTRREIFQSPLPLETALKITANWLAQPNVITVEPTGQHLRILRDLLLPLGSAGNLTSDAHLAALAIEYRAELCSSDTDFGRFPSLRWRNPLG
jgi:toxin-antitoxin system PIN domain toxin